MESKVTSFQILQQSPTLDSKQAYLERFWIKLAEVLVLTPTVG